MAATSDAQVAPTKQEIVVSVVQETLKQESILLPTVTDYSRFVAKGDSKAKVPRRDTFTPEDKLANTDLVSQIMTFSTDDIDLSKHKAIYAELERKGAHQSKVDVRAEIIMEQAKELALQVDRDLITDLKLVSVAAPDHLRDYIDTVGNVIAQGDILLARQLLNQQKVPMQGRFMVISPVKEKEMLLIPAFVEADKYGDSSGLRNGELGRIYGFTVLMHTELADEDALFYHPTHCGYATSLDPEFDEDKNLKGVKDEFLLHHIYGVKAMDSGKRGVYLDGAG